MLNLKRRIIWPVASLLLIILIYLKVGAVDFFQINYVDFVISSFFFLLSTVFWAFSWAEIFGNSFTNAVFCNAKALMGIFSPMNLGGDALRAYFSQKNKTKALASSFVVKLFKFILMAFFLITSLSLLANQLEFAQYAPTFFIMLIVTFLGAFVVLSFTSARVINFVNLFFKQNFVPRFRTELRYYLARINLAQCSRIVLWLVISTFFEICAVLFSFKCIGSEISFTYAFIISSIINSLALITITPQGIGFVEAGGLFILHFSIFGLSNVFIGSFLIIWNVIRIWAPSLVGLLLFWRDNVHSDNPGV